MDWITAIERSNSTKKEAKRKDKLKKSGKRVYAWVYVRECNNKRYRYRQLINGEKTRISEKLSKPPESFTDWVPAVY